MIGTAAMSPRAIIACAALLGWVGCRPPPPPPQSTQPAAPLVTLYGVRMQMYRGDTLALVGRAAKVAYHRQAAEMIASEALLRFPSGTTGVHARGSAVAGMEVRAAEVLGNLYTQQAEARGGVLMRTASGIVGETQRATFDGAAMKVHGPDPVELTGPGYSLQAQGFDFLFGEETFTFTGGTTTELRPGGDTK